MSIHLDDYSHLLDGLGDEPRRVLRASWTEAAKVFSPRGLENWLQGGRALDSLGRGPELVATFLQEAPAVAKEVGEDCVTDLVHSILSLASKVSGAVLEVLAATAPVAARRLGDAELFRGYLQLVSQLAAQAPRGLRPMLEHLEVLLSQLTLGGLRRWALWGAQAHRLDFTAQAGYFALETPDAQSVLQKERRGTLFVDVQRRINMYLRALWGRDFFLRPSSGDFETREGYKPFIDNFCIHLPDAYDDLLLPSSPHAAPLPQGEGPGVGKGVMEGRVTGLELYRAAAAHCAAHVVYTSAPISGEALNPLQRAVIGAIEDARVEALAIREFPGLRELWGRMHVADPAAGVTVGDWLSRLARAVIDPGHEDGHPWIGLARELLAEADLSSNRSSWEIGVRLAGELSFMRRPFNPRTDDARVPYRDDNRYFWDFDEVALEAARAAGFPTERQVRKHVSLMEFVNEVEVETAGDDAQEIWVLPTELYDDDGTTWNEREGKEPPPEPHHYPEWDYQIQLERPSWATVLEKRAALGDPARVDEILVRNKPLVSRLKHIIEAIQPQGVIRMRKQEDGEEIDLNAAVRAITDLRTGNVPDTRIMMRTVRKVRDLAVLVLLDLSESTNDKVRGADTTVLDLAREATVLLSDALARIGDPFAIHGFASDGRHDVGYYRFKDFDGAYDDKARARLAAMRGEYSTRMGAALRHAGSFLRRAPQQKKLLLLVTDGEPADIDVRDPQYLRHDTKKAVEELARVGVQTYCLSLDPLADQYVSRIFGANRYMVVDRVERLPERLPLLYMGLTR